MALIFCGQDIQLAKFLTFLLALVASAFSCAKTHRIDIESQPVWNQITGFIEEAMST
jgi:hypothetical protein